MPLDARRIPAPYWPYAFALLLVAVAFIVKFMLGVTQYSAAFTLYLPAVALSASNGLAPAAAATAAAWVAGTLGGSPGTAASVLFVVDCALVSLTVVSLASRFRDMKARLEASQRTIHELRRHDHEATIAGCALEHLEDSAIDSAVITVDTVGAITRWATGARRIYGYSADDLGLSGGRPVDRAAAELVAFFKDAATEGAAPRTAIQWRRDGSSFHAEIAVRPLLAQGEHGFTVTIQDLTPRLAWEASREAAQQAQSALQQMVDDTERRLAALEGLVDPILNPLAGTSTVGTLLERLQSTVGADGVAFVKVRADGTRVVSAVGVAPEQSEGQPIDTGGFNAGRVALIHNDPERIEQTSGVRWPSTVTSLMVVPIICDGQVRSTVEVVNERPKRATDWDVALARIVADRLAGVVARTNGTSHS